MKINNYLYIQDVYIFIYSRNILKSSILEAITNTKINTYIKMLVKTYLLNYKQLKFALNE